MNPWNTTKYTMTEQQRKSAVSKVIEKTKDRLIQRGDKIVEIINEKGKENTKFVNNWIDFVISGFDEMIEETLDVLGDWNGGKYDKPVETEKECFEKARNFWCREKSKPISNIMIHPILCQLFQHINQFNHTSSRDTVLLYIDIIYCILHREIKFTRTSSKPLILYAMFFKNNKFKQHCKMIIKCFNLDNLNEFEWGSVKVTKSVKKANEKKAKSEYIRDSNRAKDLHDSFAAHLINIQSQILNCHNINLIQDRINGFMNWMGLKINDQVKLKGNDNNDDDNKTNNTHIWSHDNDIPLEFLHPPFISHHDNNTRYNHNRSFQGMNNYINPINQIHRINASQSMRNGMIQRRESVETHIEEMRLQRYTQNRSNQNHFICGYCSHSLQPQHVAVASNYNVEPIGYQQYERGPIPPPTMSENQSVPTISTATPPQRIQEPSIPTISPFTMEMNDNYNTNDTVNNLQRIACFRNDNDNLLNNNQNNELLEEPPLYPDDIDTDIDNFQFLNFDDNYQYLSNPIEKLSVFGDIDEI